MGYILTDWLIVAWSEFTKGKLGKGTVYPRTGYEGPEKE
jgi:hypothetical protein